MSLILCGPPGTGKTTLAHVISLATQRQFVQLSALNAGVKDVRAVIENAKRELRRTRPADRAVHRRGAPVLQDPAGLAARRGRGPHRHAGRGDHREPVLLGRRAAAVALPAAHPAAADRRRHRAADRPGARPTSAAWTARSTLDRRGRATPGADRRRRRPPGADRAGGRRRVRGGRGTPTRSTWPRLETAVDRPRSATTATATSTTTSPARSSSRSAARDVDAALHYLARMIEAGEDPRFIARRLVIHASEDIGMADPTALLTAVAAADAVALHRHAGGAHHPGAGHHPPGPGAEVQRGHRGDRRRDRRRPGGPGRPGAAGAARRALRRGEEARPRRRATSTRTTTPTGGPRSSTRRTSWSAGTTTGPTDRGAEARLGRAAGQAAGDHPRRALSRRRRPARRRRPG